VDVAEADSEQEGETVLEAVVVVEGVGVNKSGSIFNGPMLHFQREEEEHFLT